MCYTIKWRHFCFYWTVCKSSNAFTCFDFRFWLVLAANFLIMFVSYSSKNHKLCIPKYSWKLLFWELRHFQLYIFSKSFRKGNCTVECLLCQAKNCTMAPSQYCWHNRLFEGEKCNDIIQGHTQGPNSQNSEKDL